MGYFATLPADIERAARIDGCSRLGVLRHVMIPMAMPGISAAFIIAFLFCWNELLFGIILTGGSTAQTLSPALQTVSQTSHYSQRQARSRSFRRWSWPSSFSASSRASTSSTPSRRVKFEAGGGKAMTPLRSAGWEPATGYPDEAASN